MKQIHFTLLLLAAGVWLTACGQPAPAGKEVAFTEHFPLAPPTYVSYQVPGAIVIDGKLSPGEWDAIPWTSEFTDIEGDKRPAPLYPTKAKITHDSLGLYIAAWMEEPQVWATITRHDAVIFQDNDFEFFIDPTGDTHHYLEYEINALGTDWDLLLTKPYRDGGKALNNWELAGIRSAVYVDGTINNPGDTDRFWSVELFIPWSSVYQVTRPKRMPEEGDQMRFNFSRVEWTTTIEDGKYVKTPIPGEDKVREYNWVWAPTGVINIHLPEYWGYVQFTRTVAGTADIPFTPDPEEEIKWILRNLYYRQREYVAAYGSFADDITRLQPEAVCPPAYIDQLAVHTTPSLYEITLQANGKTWHIRQDGLVWSSSPKKQR